MEFTLIGKSMEQVQSFGSSTWAYLGYTGCRLLNDISFNLCVAPPDSYLVAISEKDLKMGELGFLVNKNQ